MILERIPGRRHDALVEILVQARRQHLERALPLAAKHLDRVDQLRAFGVRHDSPRSIVLLKRAGDNGGRGDYMALTSSATRSRRGRAACTSPSRTAAPARPSGCSTA